MKPFKVWMFAIVLVRAWNPATTVAQTVPASAQTAANNADGTVRQVYGTIRSIKGSQIEIETRDKHMLGVDAAPAIKNHRTGVLTLGRTVVARGPYSKGVLHADTIQRAKSSPAAWPADR